MLQPVDYNAKKKLKALKYRATSAKLINNT